MTCIFKAIGQLQKIIEGVISLCYQFYKIFLKNFALIFMRFHEIQMKQSCSDEALLDF